MAEQAVTPEAWSYMVGGAGDERTLRWNREAFSRFRLRPRVLVDVSSVSTETTVLGTPVSMPALVAPMAFQQIAHEEGEVAMARGAGAAGHAHVRLDRCDCDACRDRRGRAGCAALAPDLRVSRPGRQRRGDRAGARGGVHRTRADSRPPRLRHPASRSSRPGSKRRRTTFPRSWLREPAAASRRAITRWSFSSPAWNGTTSPSS